MLFLGRARSSAVIKRGAGLFLRIGFEKENQGEGFFSHPYHTPCGYLVSMTRKKEFTSIS
jgi:hypothetical protein